MVEAVKGNPDPAPEMIAESLRVAGRLLAPDDNVAGAGYFERSARMLRLVGNLAAASEVERDATDALAVAVRSTAGQLKITRLSSGHGT